MKKLSIAYFGTPNFSAEVLEKIMTDANIPVSVKLVVTQPDRPVGRNQILTPSPVKLIAQKYQIPLSYESKAVSNTEIDIALVFAYGAILPKDLLRAPRYGFWNIHPSLLPKYRNTSPTVYALLLGDKKTGVTLINVDEKLDHGPIIAQEKYEIPDNIKNDELIKKLSEIGFELFSHVIQSITTNLKPEVHSQDDSVATYTKMLKKEDGFISIHFLRKALKGEMVTKEELPNIIKLYLEKYPSTEYSIYNAAIVVNNMFRALFPWPGIWTKIIVNGIEKRLKITDLAIEKSLLEIRKIQLEGKNEQNYSLFKQLVEGH